MTRSDYWETVNYPDLPEWMKRVSKPKQPVNKSYTKIFYSRPYDYQVEYTVVRGKLHISYWRSKHSEPQGPPQRGINWKWTIIWIFIHSFSVWLMSYFLVAIANEFLYVILAGLGITIIAKIMRTITRHASFRFDKNFIFWFCTITFSFWIVRLILQFVQIQGGIIYYILMGCGIFALGQIIRDIR
jgi:multidrug transporter EmrE-like cation transporter